MSLALTISHSMWKGQLTQLPVAGFTDSNLDLRKLLGILSSQRQPELVWVHFQIHQLLQQDQHWETLLHQLDLNGSFCHHKHWKS